MEPTPTTTVPLTSHLIIRGKHLSHLPPSVGPHNKHSESSYLLCYIEQTLNNTDSNKMHKNIQLYNHYNHIYSGLTGLEIQTFFIPSVSGSSTFCRSYGSSLDFNVMFPHAFSSSSKGFIRMYSRSAHFTFFLSFFAGVDFEGTGGLLSVFQHIPAVAGTSSTFGRTFLVVVFLVFFGQFMVTSPKITENFLKCQEFDLLWQPWYIK